ncbi:MAG: hypothetical protein ACD_60C00068G0024 [uncultured bacterium]|nr:MAG: hypothetical protein ACD_60C00068G0024 [uncultured bacterium]
MLIAAIVFFILAASLGLVLLTAILRDRPTYKPIVFMHGTIAGIALIILVTYVALGHTDTLLITSLVLFVLAALGGFTLFTFDINDKPIPKKLAIMHPLLAVVSLILLIVYVAQTV